MARLLTSWKEIAHYVGKGVRTVQRWEQELAFPVRRPSNARKQVVLASVDDIDDWVRRQTSQRNTSSLDTESLRARVEFLEAENERLQRELGREPTRSADCNAEEAGLDSPLPGGQKTDFPLTATCRVLVVDDNEAQCYALSRMLEATKFSVIQAKTGMAAIVTALDQQPELIMLDINLPDVDGFIVAETLKSCAKTRDLPIIFYSADTSTYQNWNATGRGVFLTTPVEPDQLLYVVRGTLARRAQGGGDTYSAEGA